MAAVAINPAQSTMFDLPTLPEPAHVLRIVHVPLRSTPRRACEVCAEPLFESGPDRWTHLRFPEDLHTPVPGRVVLYFAPELDDPRYSTAPTLDNQFWTFHTANPHVYAGLVVLARALRARGHDRLGIGMLFEVLRWQHMLHTDDPVTPFKLNNNLRSRFARLIMETEPDLTGAFEIRELR